LPFVLGDIVVSGLILFVPTRLAVRNLLRAERSMDLRIDRLGTPAIVVPETIAEHHATTPAELAALDARLARPRSARGESAIEEPER
jgi:hypothetical protein